jgi:hypothetical protein
LRTRSASESSDSDDESELDSDPEVLDDDFSTPVVPASGSSGILAYLKQINYNIRKTWQDKNKPIVKISVEMSACRLQHFQENTEQKM